MKTKKIYTDADLEAIKYFKLTKTEYILIIAKKMFGLNKENDVVDYNEITAFVNGFYKGQKTRETK